MGTIANIEFAHDGQEALDYLFNDANTMPRLVLLDLNLPDSTGSGCCSASAKTSAHA